MASKLQADIKKWLKPLCMTWAYKHKGKWCWEHALRVNTSGYRGSTVATAPNGWTDINCILKDGTHVYIEVKRTDETIKPSQEAFMEQLRTRGIICFVARSMEDVEKNFKAFGI